jgi:hypothetical protein
VHSLPVKSFLTIPKAQQQNTPWFGAFFTPQELSNDTKSTTTKDAMVCEISL